MDTSTRSQFSAKWAQRFEFFDQHGAPNTPTFKAALKQLDFLEKIKMNANIWALFFGPFYLLVLGLWKKALVLTGIAITIFLLAAVLGLPDLVQGVLNFAVSLVYALITNYAYYLKCIKGQDGWNAFEGIRL